MQAVVMHEAIVKPPVYDARPQVRGIERAWSRTPVLTVATASPQGGGRLQVEDWDNGDPPDLILWGEE